jgi:hypothetical protein
MSSFANSNSEYPTAEIEVTWSIPPEMAVPITFDDGDLIVAAASSASASASASDADLLPLLQRSPSARPTKRMATGTKFRLLPGLTPTIHPPPSPSDAGSTPVKRAA